MDRASGPRRSIAPRAPSQGGVWRLRRVLWDGRPAVVHHRCLPHAGALYLLCSPAIGPDGPCHLEQRALAVCPPPMCRILPVLRSPSIPIPTSSPSCLSGLKGRCLTLSGLGFWRNVLGETGKA